MKKSYKAALLAAFLLAQSMSFAACSRQSQIGVEKLSSSLQEETTKEPAQAGEAEADEENDRKPGEESRRLQAPAMSEEEYPRVDGSTATIPLSTALYRLVTASSQEEALKAVNHTKTTRAYQRLIHGEVDLVIAYEPAQVVYDDMEETGQELMIKPIGKDALVFMANEGNPVTSLSQRELVGIYTGRYKDWSQVGGEQSEIIAFQRPENSGSQTLMEKLVMKGIPMGDAPQTRVIGDMGELIEEVASYNNERNALGYSVYFYARNMYQKPGLKVMAVDGVMPDNETIKKGEYPYVNEFYAAVRSDEPHDSTAYQLFSWLTTEDGQALIESLGYVGIGEAKDIQVDLEEASAPQPGTVTLEEGFRILMNGDYLDKGSGVVVLDENLAVEQTLTDKRLDGAICNIRGNEAAVMTDTATGLQGLYSVEEGRWVAEPVYQYMGLQPDGTYSVYKGEEMGRVFWDEQKHQYSEAMGIFEKVGDCWWRQTGEVYDIFEGDRFPARDSVPIKTLDLSGSGFNYGYPDHDLYILRFQDNSQKIYESHGELLFGEETTGKKSRIRGRSSRWVWAWDLDAGPTGSSYVFNYEKGQVITREGDEVEQADGDSRFFTVVRDGEVIVLDEYGETVLSRDHQTFDRVLERGFCGRWDQGILTVENPDTKKTFEVSCPEHVRGYMINDHLLYLYGLDEDQDFRAVYLDGALLMDQDYLYYYGEEDPILLYGQERQVIVSRQGKILYETGPQEQILWAYPEYLVIQRGNYLCITDYEGTSGFQALEGYMGDD